MHLTPSEKDIQQLELQTRGLPNLFKIILMQPP